MIVPEPSASQTRVAPEEETFDCLHPYLVNPSIKVCGQQQKKIKYIDIRFYYLDLMSKTIPPFRRESSHIRSEIPVETLVVSAIQSGGRRWVKIPGTENSILSCNGIGGRQIEYDVLHQYLEIMIRLPGRQIQFQIGYSG